MRLSFGAELQRRRLATGVSLTRFARTVNYSKSHLSKIENGVKLPGPELARICDSALGAGGKLAELVPARHRNASPPRHERVHGDNEWRLALDPSGAGEFDAGRPQMPMTWGPVANAAAHRYDDAVLESFRLQFDQTRRLTQTLPPAALLPLLIAPVHALRVGALSAQPPYRAPLFILASRYAELAGWMTQEAGDNDGALRWTDLAVTYAEAGGDPRLSAYALVRRANIAMHQRDAAATIALSQDVQRADCGARIRGLAAQREAQGHSLAGDYDRCRRALDRAATWLAQPGEDTGEPLLGSSTVQNLTDMTYGWCLHELGRPEEAGLRLRAQLGQTPPWAHRTRGRLGARYALTLLSAGELELGCAALRSALDNCSGLDSATIRTDLRQVARQLHRRMTHDCVRAVMPRLTEVLAS
ncbi:helix-turn-helix domain-containing protein [Actinoplanes sp. NPDC004185]